MHTRGHRPTIVLCVLYGALIGGWLGFARGLAPSMITSMPHEPTIPLLNRLVQTWRISWPPATAHERWLVFSSAVAIGGVCHLAFVLFVRTLDRWGREQRPAIDGAGDRWTSIAAVLLALAFLTFTIARGALQDYFLFLQVWREVRLGHDPWFLVTGVWGEYPLNAYGPLFNVLAVPAAINELLPKLLFALAYLGFAIWLVKGAGESRRLSGCARVLLLVWLFGPFPWVEIAHFGHFDVLVGLLCVAAVEARVRGRDVASGVSLGLGVLLKYMPVVLLPFLVLNHGRIRSRPGLVSAATIALGLGASLLLWGRSTFRPLLFAASRRSEYLSIYRFLKGSYSPLNRIEFNENLDQWAVPILLAALLLTWSWARRNAIGPLASSVVAVLVTLLFYQVGFPQYQMVLFVLGSYWAVRYRPVIRNGAALWIAMVCYFAWLSVFDLIDSFGRLQSSFIPEWAGVPTFLLGCVLLIRSMRSATAEQHTFVPQP